jgi:hypothetical protein
MPHPKRPTKIADPMTCIICRQEIIPTKDDPIGHESWPLGSFGVPLTDTGESDNTKCCKQCFHDKVMIARVIHDRNRKQIFGR